MRVGRSSPSLPARSGFFSAGDAERSGGRGGAWPDVYTSLGFLVLFSTLVEYWSRRRDLLGQVQPVQAFFLVAVRLRWQERWQAAKGRRGISSNKATPSSPRHLLWLCWSSNQSTDRPLLRPHPWWMDNGSGGSEDGFPNKRSWVHRSCHLQRPPPRVCGRAFGFDGEPFSPSWLWYGPAASSTLSPLLLSRALGVMVASGKGVCRVVMLRRWHRSPSEASSWSTTSAAHMPAVIQASEAWHIFNLHWRPLPRLAVASHADFEASGFVPASKLDGDLADLLLVGGEREGPDCFLLSFSEALSASIRDLCVLFYFMGSFVVYCSPTVCFQ